MKRMKIVQVFFGMAMIVGMTGGKAFSQEPQWEESGEIESVEIEIVKERQITLPRANRNFEKIAPRPAEPIKPEIRYDTKGLRFEAPDFVPVIKPLRLKQEELSKIYGGYVSAGFGNYNAPFLLASINTKRDADKFYGLDLAHRSYGKGPIDGKNSASGNTRLNFFATGFGPKITADAGLHYENLSTYFYGYQPPVSGEVRRDSIFQGFHIFGLSAGVKNTKPSDFNFKLNGAFSYLTDHYNASESDVDINFNSDYKIDDDKALLFKMDYSLLARKDLLVEPKPRHLFKVAPAYRFKVLDDLTITAGLKVAVENDSVGKRPVHVYPDVHARYAMSDAFESYASLSGDIDKVSLHTLVQENLWIAPNIPVFHTNKALEFTAGIKGTIARKVLAHAGLSVTRFSHLYFYQNTLADQSKFTLSYDNAVRLNFFGETGLVSSDKILVSLRGDYYSYATDSLAHPWHRPKYKVSLNSTFKIVDKVLLTFNLVGQGGMKAYDNELSMVTNLPAAIDLNVKLRYLLSKQFSVLVEGNNILNSKYPLYLHYPVRGAQVSAGLSWSF